MLVKKLWRQNERTNSNNGNLTHSHLSHNGNYLSEEKMIWIGIFIGGFVGMLIMALLQIGKISGLYRQLDICKMAILKLNMGVEKEWENE